MRALGSVELQGKELPDMRCRGLNSRNRVFYDHMGGCQHCGPFLGTLNIRCRIRIGTQKGTIILTTTHIRKRLVLDWLFHCVESVPSFQALVGAPMCLPAVRAWL